MYLPAVDRAGQRRPHSPRAAPSRSSHQPADRVRTHQPASRPTQVLQSGPGRSRRRKIRLAHRYEKTADAKCNAGSCGTMKLINRARPRLPTKMSDVRWLTAWLHVRSINYTDMFCHMTGCGLRSRINRPVLPHRRITHQMPRRNSLLKVDAVESWSQIPSSPASPPSFSAPSDHDA